MAEFKLGRLRFVWQGEWTTATAYVKDDIIRYGGISYVCAQAHTANADFYVDRDATRWEVMTAGIQYKSAEWTTGVVYAENDIVRYGGKVYISLDGHTAGSDFFTDKDSGKWNLFVDGVQWKTTVWTAATYYKEGDLVRHGGRVYICVDGHTASAGFETDFNANDWQLFADGTQWVSSWTASTLYKVGDIVRVSGKTYVCINEHSANATARGGFYSDLSNWNLYADGNQYRGAWDTDAYYWVGDFVRYGAKNYICMLGHEASADFYTNFDNSNWQLLTDGQQWLSVWNTATYYKEGDIISHGGSTYICVNGHLSDAVAVEGFDRDLTANQWQIFALGYEWKNQWATGTYYKHQDVVRYGAKAYICVDGHVAAADFYTDVDAVRWNLLVDGQQWKTSPWQVGSLYKEGDLVRYGGRVYICVDGHTSSGFANRFDIDFDAGDWQLFADGTQWKTDMWTASTYYKTGDIVKYGAKTYIAINDHESDAEQDGGFYIDLTANEWDLYADGTEWTGDWVVDTYYKVGDIARYDGNVYVCQIPHRSASTISQGLELDLDADIELSKWTVFSEGFKFKGEWDTEIKYNVNDVVKFGGSLYICVEYHTSDVASFQEIYWNILIGGLQFEDTWSPNVEYQIGDIVTYGGYAYVSSTRNTGRTPPGFLSDWEILTTGFKLRGDWSSSVSYKVGEVVNYGGGTYVAVVETGPGQSPIIEDIDVTSPTYEQAIVSPLWEIVAQGFNWRGSWDSWDIEPDPLADPVVPGTARTYRVGDSVRWVANSYICILDHTALADSSNQPDNDTNGIYWDALAEGAEGNKLARRGDLLTRDATQNKRLPRGLTGQVLQVQNKDVVWDYFNVVDNVYYVDVNGVDGPARGTSLQTAFRTIKYATEYILADEANRAPASIFVKTGTFREELPIIIPANVAIVGDELRSTRMEPAPGRGVESVEIITPGTNYLAVPTVTIAPPTLSGGVTAQAVATIAAGAVTGITITRAGSGYVTAPVITITPAINDTGDGAVANATLKLKLYSQTDMFYMRDGSGLRNCTTAGLDVPLGPVNQYLTRRPITNCAYTSLDPGYGPGDESAWVVNRSPYVQNVTTFGSGAVGLKVDGALHNGGNKTIVCNDFTQVISDGIGVWCTNQGRAEAVSVFTYYAHLGYLSEDGGVIRGTNGNCSYGTFGVSAEGVDPSEVSRIAQVNNRKQEATVANTFTDGQGIVVLEYANAGENYQAGNTTFEFGGSGAANSIVVNTPVVQNGAVKEVRVLSSGKDWLAVTNNAQDGNSYTIRLSASDVQVSNAYRGERIVIIDGQGVGQYGYITNFNGGTKVATVAKESFAPLVITATSSLNNRLTTSNTATLTVNQAVTFDSTTIGNVNEIQVYFVKAVPTSTQFTISETVGGSEVNLTTASGSMTMHGAGWQSLYGQAIETTLDTTSRYSIEPRVVFSTGSGATATGVISKGVSTITINGASAGGHYQAVPTILISGTEDNAQGATAEATISAVVESVRIRQGGSGFTGTPLVQFIGGGLPANSINHATGTATVTGTISSVSVTNGGTGYTNPPLVSISGTGYNTDAYVSAKITNVLGEITVVSGGGGFTAVPSVILTGGGGTGAIAVVNLDAFVTGFVIEEGGSGYTQITTTVTIIPGAGDTTGSGATAEIVIDNGVVGGPGVITGITLIDAGGGYTKRPLVSITSIGLGEGAEITTLFSGSISSVTVTQGGSGYTSAPNVTFSSGTAVATASITGSVNELEIISGGSGFTGTVSLTVVPVSDFIYDKIDYSSELDVLIKAVTSDIVFGSNYQSITAGTEILQSYSNLFLDSQDLPTIAAINRTRDLMLAETANTTARNRISANFALITNIVDVGSTPALVYPTPANTATGITDGSFVIQENREFLQAEIVAWVNDKIAGGVGIWLGFTYNSATFSTNAGYIIDALAYDLLYGGNSQSKYAAQTYRLREAAVIAAQVDQTVAAYNYLRSIIDEVVQNTPITPTTGNIQSQNTVFPAGSSTAATNLQTLLDVVVDIIQDGSTATATVNPTFANGDVSATIKTAIDAESTAIQTAVTDWIDATYIGANATAVASITRVVNSVIITSPGTGYTKVPVVSITGGGGTGALGSVIIDGSIDGITVTAPGKNYTTTPTIAFTGAHNFRSIVTGEAYYRSTSSLIAISSVQLTQTLAAMEYVKVLASAIATDTDPVTEYQTLVSRTGTGTAPAGAYDQTEFWIDVIKAISENGADNSIAADLIAENKIFIQEEARNYATANSGIVVYVEANLTKNIGILIDALVYDLSNGTTERTVAIGQQYAYLVDSESVFTLAVLTHVNDIIQDIIVNTIVVPQDDGVTTWQGEWEPNTAYVLNDAVIFSGTTYVAQSGFTSSIISFATDLAANLWVEKPIAQVFAELSASEITAPIAVDNCFDLWRSIVALDSVLGDTGNSSYVDLLVDNTLWIQAEVTEYIKTTYPTFDYNQSLCARDIKLIIDALAQDVEFAQEAIPLATATTTNVLSDITVVTGGDGYGSGTTVSFSSLNTGTTPVATPIITNGVITGFNITTSGTGFTSPPAVTINADTGSGALARAYVLGAAVQEIRIIRPGSGYSASPYIKLIDPNNTIEGSFGVRIGNGVLDQPTFTSRGIGYLAAATVISSPTGFADSFQVGEFIYVQNLTNVPTPGANLQIEGNDQFYKLVTIRELTGAAGIIGGRNLILANRSFVQQQIIAHINATYPSLNYDRDLCSRDVGLIVDAIAADIFGDTERGIEAGKSYYRSASSLLAISGAQRAATLASLAKIEEYLISIVQNIDIVRNQLFELQVKEPNITQGADSIDALSNTIDIITDIIQNGDEMYGVQDLLLDNKPYIQAEVIAFINTTYPELIYNQELCRRDVGLIVDALTYDLFAGLALNFEAPNVPSGLTRSREAGLRYYSNPSALIAINEQVVETVAAIEHIAFVALAVANNNAPTVVYQTAVVPVTNPSVNISVSLENRIQDGIDEIVNIIENGLTVLPQGTYSARLQVSPLFTVDNVPAHNASITIRSKYSQVRISAHDFLNVGTGNKAATNYPGLPVNAPDVENEVLESGGGRCFYTSTDQDGNFRVGELFRVEQSTGIATLNADAFNLSGLNELSLGGVNLGGTGATITEFSTDSTFLANSDSIVPTQRAIKTFIESQLGSGGGNLAVNAITAGDIQVTGTEISTNADLLDIIAPLGVIISETLESTSTTTGSLIVDGGVGIANNVFIGGTLNVETDLVVTGNLTVNGTTTEFNVGTLSVEDINVTIAKDALTAAAANGAGITVAGPTTPATITYASADDSWNLNKLIKATSIQNTPVGSTTKSTGAFTTLTANNSVTFTDNTATSGASSGAVVVTGGVGIGGGLSVGGAISTVGLGATGSVTLNPTNASVQVNPSGTGGVVISPTGSAGLTVNPTTVGTIDNVNIGSTTRGPAKFTTLETNSDVLITSATASTGVNTGSLQVDGGVGINGAVYAGSIQNTPIGSTTANTGRFTTGAFTSTTASTTTGTGAVTIDGGLGVAGAIWAGSINVNGGGIDNTPIGSVTRNTGAFTTLAANSTVTFTGGTTSTTSTTGQLQVTGGVGISENLNVGGQLTVTGNLTVNGTTSTINSTTITVDDIEIELGSVASPTDVTANGGGIRLKGATDKTIRWISATGFWTFDQPVQASSIQNTPVGSTTRNTGAFTTLAANSAVTMTAGTASTTTGTGTLVVTGGVGVSGQVTATTHTGNHDGGTGSFTTLGASSTVTLSPANASVAISPSGTGNVVINPATAGTINNMSIGVTTRAAGAFTTLSANSTFSITDATESSTTGTGSLVTSGGLGVAKQATINNVSITASTASSTTGTGALIVAGGAGIAGAIFAGSIQNTPIGSSTRNTGAFTTLTANNAVTLTAGTASSTTGTGTLVVTGGVGISGQLTAATIVETSSIAYKEDVNPIVDALDAVMQLVGVTYARKDTHKYEAGLIAEEVNKVLPDLVSKNAEGNPEGIQYTKLTAYLIEAVKSLKAEIDVLKGSK